MMSLLIFKERKLGLEKQIIVIWFWEKYPSAKEPVGPDDIIFVSSKHVETVVLMSRKDK